MIKFILNNEIITTSEQSGVILLDFIRENKQLKGTKIGCREGDCGACTVLVGTLEKDKISYQSITSCISPLGNAQGKHILTIEGVNLPKKLNVSQQVMADNYATQCGFCTPGFVVSMTGFALKTVENTAINSTCNDAISGNICRCTGYKSIEKATNQLEELLKPNYSLEDLITNGFVPEYLQTIPERLQKCNILGSKPNISNETIVANGTDLYVRYADKLSEQSVQLIGNEPLLKGIHFKDGICTIGASTTVTELLDNDQLQRLFPKLKPFLKLVSSEQIRNMGTLGGNFVNASPIGDMSIFFLALNSQLTIQLDKKTRTIPLDTFHQDYKKYDLNKGELIQSISFNVPDNSTFFNFEKVSKRTHLDIASVNAACKISIKNEIIKEAYFSIGGVAAIPKLLQKTNNFLIGKSISVTTIKKAEVVLQSEITPISDVRGTTIYKRLLARQLFFAHFVCLFPSISLQNLLAK